MEAINANNAAALNDVGGGQPGGPGGGGGVDPHGMPKQTVSELVHQVELV